jgi:hypothetical protein
LVNVVNIPTFGDSILDKFFCQNNLQSFKVATAPGLGSALHSHNIVVISRDSQPNDDNVSIDLHKVYDLRKSFVMSFCNQLATTDWSFLSTTSDVDHCVKLFYERIDSALSVIPVSFVKFTSKTKPWITPIVIDLINKRWKAFRDKNFCLYRHYKKKVKEEIVKSKKIWSDKMCNSSKGVWAIVNDVRGKTDSNSVNRIVSLFSDCVTAAESINTSFSDLLVKSENFSILPVDKNVGNICNADLVYNFLRSLKTNKACGSDDILPILLKESAEVLCKPLCFIINMSFEKSVVPSVWKIADICPVPKTSPVRRDKLRPISLLPIMSKICERVVLKEYREPLLRSYDNSQFAYRPHSSTVCALIYIHEIILKFLDDVNIRAVRLITFDLSRAFDCIPHHLLLSCISKLDLPHCNSFVNWLRSYLYGRVQRVKLGNTRSSSISVCSGVPQGSVLGPILFAVYLSTYKPLGKTIHVIKYADDVSLVVPVYKNRNDDISCVNLEIEHFQSWCRNHQMSINFSKTKVLNINFGRIPVTPIPSLENVTTLKILGLLFNNRLTWSDHFHFIVKKMSQRLYVLRILKPLLPHDQLVSVFNAIILSVMDYGSHVFLNCGSGLNSKLLSVCKRAFRIIHGFHVTRCDRCNFFELDKRRKFLALKLFRNALNSADHVLHNLLPHFSCRSNRIILPHVRTKRRLGSFISTCSLMYNENL